MYLLIVNTDGDEYLNCTAQTAVSQFNQCVQNNRIDIIRHDAPELAHFGEYRIGVRTLEFTDSNRPDVLNTARNGETVLYDRSLMVEVWYPAQLAEHQQPGVDYTTTTRNLDVTATLRGRAVRDAAALSSAGVMPLVIISHGYPGNRYLMSHLAGSIQNLGRSRGPRVVEK